MEQCDNARAAHAYAARIIGRQYDPWQHVVDRAVTKRSIRDQLELPLSESGVIVGGSFLGHSGQAELLEPARLVALRAAGNPSLYCLMIASVDFEMRTAFVAQLFRRLKQQQAAFTVNAVDSSAFERQCDLRKVRCGTAAVK